MIIDRSKFAECALRSYLTPATLKKVSNFRLSTETLGRVRPRGAMCRVTLFVSGRGTLGRRLLDGGEEDAEDAKDEVDSGSDEERGVVEPGLVTVPPAAANMAWVPLARISCVSCRRFMSPSSEFSSASVMAPRSRSCTQHSSLFDPL